MSMVMRKLGGRGARVKIVNGPDTGKKGWLMDYDSTEGCVVRLDEVRVICVPYTRVEKDTELRIVR